ncbi:MAG: histidinol-phosphate transaminase [archaeon]
MNLHEILLGIGQKNIYKYYKAYQKSQYWPRDKLKVYQEKRIRQVIDHAYNRVPFYRNKYDKLSLKPQDFKVLSDLEKFPIISVEELKDAVSKGMTGNQRNIKMLETTGSTGTPFVFPINKEAEDERYGCTFRTIEWYGHHLGTKNARLWRTSKKSFMSRLKENFIGRRFELSIYDADRPEDSFMDGAKIKMYLKKLSDYKPEVIDGYVSAFVLISDYILRNNIRAYSPKAIVTGAEYLSHEARKTIEKAFRCRVFNRYGGTETSLMAHECDAGRGSYYHIMADKLYLEVIRENRTARPGELGEIVVTDFTNKALPFIRFRVGDVAIAEDPEKICKCKRTLPLLGEVQGRVNDLFKLKNGKILVTHVWHKLFREIPEIKEFQIRQKDLDKFEVFLVLDKKDYDITNLKKKVSDYLPDSNIDWWIVDKIPVGKGGKFRHSISEVPLSLNEIRSGIVAPARYILDIKPYKVVPQKAFSDRQNSMKLDWNEGTISPPKEIVDGLCEFIRSKNAINWYPDISHDKIKEEIAKYVELSKEYIEVFVGSDGALDYLAKTFLDKDDKVLVVSPTYDQFRVSLESRKAEVKFVFGESPFKKNIEGIIGSIDSRTRMIYLVNPNNPTGWLYTRDEIISILKKAKHALLLLDEAYIEFCKDASCKDLVREYPNLIILRTFSKAFCMAGIRLGYIIANPEHISYIRRIKNSKEVSELSEVAAILALQNIRYMEKYVREVNNAKDFFALQLKERGYEVYNGSGNFVMLKVESPDKFISHLMKYSIFIRDRSYLPQLENFVRITIGNKRQMNKTLKAIDEFK